MLQTAPTLRGPRAAPEPGIGQHRAEPRAPLDRERIAGIHRLSIDTIELYERTMIDELALRLVHGKLPVGS